MMIKASFILNVNDQTHNTAFNAHVLRRDPVQDNEYTLDELLTKVAEANLHSETDIGGPIGIEVC